MELEEVDLLREKGIIITYKNIIYYTCDSYVKDIKVTISNDDDDDIGYININCLRCLENINYDIAYEYSDMVSNDFREGFTDCIMDYEKNSSTKFYLENFTQYIYIDLMCIYNQFRSQGLGTALIKEIIDTIGKEDTIFVVKPFPFENKKSLKDLKKVKSFWKNIGFKKMYKSDYYYLLT